ncbi:MAG: hypothetical protein M3Q06_09185, partial [Bacteroidota bacterium]|nr:hypothetical protein [Bacteroidota bacterium]
MRLLYQLTAILFMIAFASCKTSKLATAQKKEGFTSNVNPFVGTTPLTDPRIVGFVTPKGWR